MQKDAAGAFAVEGEGARSLIQSGDLGYRIRLKWGVRMCGLVARGRYLAHVHALSQFALRVQSEAMG